MAQLLTVEHLHAGYGPIEVLKDISLAVNEGEIVTMIGANGAGKTTTLMTISGAVRARAGRIVFQGREIQNLPPHEIVRLGLCQSPEGRKIFPTLTVMENLEMGSYLKGPKTMRRETMAAVFSLFPVLEKRKKQLGGTLSGG